MEFNRKFNTEQHFANNSSTMSYLDGTTIKSAYILEPAGWLKWNTYVVPGVHTPVKPG